MRTFLDDARFTLRSLKRQPGFAAVVITTLALGIGANTALFSILDAVVLRPLPYREPDRVVTLWETAPRKSRVAAANFLDWRAEAKSFSGMAAFSARGMTLSGNGEAERIGGAAVTADYFDVLGVKSAAGRLFLERDQAPGPAVAILGYDLWKRRFAGDPGVVGQTIALDGTPYEILGVTSPGLYPSWPSATGRLSFAERTQQIFVPMRLDSGHAANRNSHVMGVVARLGAGVSLEDAQGEVRALGDRLASLYPATNEGENILASPIATELMGEARPALLALFAAVGLLLALACANVASLLLARGTAREREVAVRRALGASATAIARLVVTESVLLALVGGALGVVLAALAVPALLALLPADIPRLENVQVDARVLLFAALSSLLTALGFGLFPAWRAAKSDPGTGLRDGGAGSGDGRGQRARRILIVAQVAIALVLVTSGLLLGRSFWKLRAVDPGFKAQGVLSFQVVLPSRFADLGEVATAYDQMLEQFRSLPGAHTAAVAYDSPLESNWIDSFEIEGQADPKGAFSAHLGIVSDDYFETLSVPILSGRALDARDRLGAEGAIVVSRSFAERFFPDADPVGHWLRLGTPSAMGGPAAPTRFQIVGLSDNVHSMGLAKGPEPTYYLSARQFPQRDMTVLLGVSGLPMSALSGARAELHRFDAEIALLEPRALTESLDAKVAQPRFNMIALLSFAGMALVLTAVGLYGLLSYSVARRVREIGVRLALGARPDEIRRLIMGEGLRLVGAGLVVGLVGAFAGNRALSALLFEVSPDDAVSVAAGLATLVVAGTLAALIPARRAQQVTPASALRTD